MKDLERCLFCGVKLRCYYEAVHCENKICQSYNVTYQFKFSYYPSKKHTNSVHFELSYDDKTYVIIQSFNPKLMFIRNGSWFSDVIVPIFSIKTIYSPADMHKKLQTLLLLS